MLDNAAFVLDRIISVLWGPATVILFLSVGIFLTVRLGVPQLFGIKYWLVLPVKTLFGKDKNNNKGVLCTVLAATVGTGNIVGVAAALITGGPGAVFWMWVSAFFGMALGFAENLLGIRYRTRRKDGSYIGGAAFYIEKGLNSKPLAITFSVACAAAAFGIGNLTQGNSMAGSIIAAAEGMGFAAGEKTAIVVGIITAVLAAPAIIGGKDRISKAAERIVPAAVVIFLAVSLIIIYKNRHNVLWAMSTIFSGAFGTKAFFGGTAGYGIATVIRTGLSRGLFSHEAGMGSSVAVHTTVDNENPLQTGLYSMFEVFVDTFVVCTLTALVIITSISNGKTVDTLTAAQLVAGAFSDTFKGSGNIIVAVLLYLFGFATILGWGCFGQTAFSAVFKKGVLFYKIAYVTAIPIGCVLNMQVCWYLSDVFNWLMAIINIFAVTVLSKTVISISKDCKNRRVTIKYGTKKGSGNT